MFKVGDHTTTVSGNPARIIATDAAFVPPSGIKCNIIAAVKTKGTITETLVYCNEAGKFNGGGVHPQYDLVSNEPNDEEAALIQEIGNLVEGSVKDRELAMLKIIRKLRAK